MAETELDCYIYFKTAQEHAPAVLAQVTKIQKILIEQLNIRMQLQRRPEAMDGLYTWMEVYRQIPSDFEASLSAIVNQSSLMPLIQGERHAEYFMDAISCA
jgi:hypothetical protein